MAQPLLAIVRRARRRERFGRLLGGLVDVFVFGLLSAVALAAAAAAGALGAPLTWLLGAGLVGLLAAYLGWTVLRDSSMETVAARLDRQLGLHDRISSALVFARQSRQTDFMRAHLREAEAFLTRGPAPEAPMPWPRRGRWAAVFLGIALFALVPHGDRRALVAVERQQALDNRLRQGRQLATELEQLRRTADQRGLKKLSNLVADAQRVLEERLALFEPEDLKPPDEPPAATGEADSTARKPPREDVIRTTPGGAVDGEASKGPQLSRSAVYQPSGKFDAFPDKAYSEVFAELDAALLDAGMTGEQLQNLSAHVQYAADRMGTFGSMQDGEAPGWEGGMRGPEGDRMAASGEYDPFEKALAPLQFKAFSEFLKRYSAHLGDQALGKSRFETSDEPNDGGEVFNVSAPPPKDATFALQGVGDQPPNAPLLQGTPEQQALVAQQLRAGGRMVPDGAGQQKKSILGAGTDVGGQGAGSGGAGQQVAAPAVLPRASGGEYMPLEGKLADGRSIVELIDQRGRGNLVTVAAGGVTFHDVFLSYAKGAEAELNSEQVPLQMRDYVREYFRSIRPRAGASPAPPAGDGGPIVEPKP